MKRIKVYTYDGYIHKFEQKNLGHAFTDGFLEVTGEDWAHLIPAKDISKIEVSITEE